MLNKKNEDRLQILENKLANITQGNLSIAENFLKIMNLCDEISLFNSEEPISEARMKRILIRGLKPEYIPFVTSIKDGLNNYPVRNLKICCRHKITRQVVG